MYYLLSDGHTVYTENLYTVGDFLAEEINGHFVTGYIIAICEN